MYEVTRQRERVRTTRFSGLQQCPWGCPAPSCSGKPCLRAHPRPSHSLGRLRHLAGHQTISSPYSACHPTAGAQPLLDGSSSGRTAFVQELPLTEAELPSGTWVCRPPAPSLSRPWVHIHFSGPHKVCPLLGAGTPSPLLVTPTCSADVPSQPPVHANPTQDQLPVPGLPHPPAAPSRGLPYTTVSSPSF